MTSEGLGKDNDVKVRFNTREGIYKLMPISEHFYTRRSPYVAQGLASTSTSVKTTIAKINKEEGQEKICYTIGRDLFYFCYKSLMQPAHHLDILDKRMYKGVAPSCHDINQFSSNSESVKVAVGFTAGQVQIIDVKAKQSLQIMNEDRMVEKSTVTCVKWYPDSENMLLSSHSSGCMYTYDISQPFNNSVPVYHTQPHVSGDGYCILALKVKSNVNNNITNGNGNSQVSKNPLYKWVMSPGGSGVRFFEFSPCGRFIAIVMQNGYLRVLDLTTFELLGFMKSYFGGLLTCCWSPDSRYIVTGGEDDLVQVWSFCEKCVVARGYGHKSWVSSVAFDPYCCSIPSDSDIKTFYNIPSIAEVYPKVKPPCSNQGSPNNNSHQHINDDYAFGDEGRIEDNRITCNGEAGISPHSTMRRLRTYSNVSKFSRLSIGLDLRAPPLCYRFGSVGQDAHLCLWELDENVLFFAQRAQQSLTNIAQKKRQSSSSGVDCTPAYTSATDSDVPVNGTSTYSDYSSESSQYHYHNHTHVENIDVTRQTSQSSSSITSSTGSSKEHKTKQQNVGNELAEKFATLGSRERSRKNGKEHKRNLSLPFSFRSSNSSHANSKHTVLNKKNQPSQTPESLGTTPCPRLRETPQLEPLVCKKVAQSRMTGINFLEDCIITTCQDGYLQLWKRPLQTKTSPSSNSTSSPTSKIPGTVV